jgi:hypothetical protein
MHRFDKGLGVLWIDMLVDAMTKVEDMTGATAVTLENGGHFGADALR